MKFGPGRVEARTRNSPPPRPHPPGSTTEFIVVMDNVTYLLMNHLYKKYIKRVEFADSAPEFHRLPVE